MSLTDHARQTIEQLIDNNRVVLFMKGTPQAPQCGFSATAVGILGSVAPDFASFNVLEDPEVREGIKAFGNWPTIPQLYIDRELIGGSDIVSQMFNSGELHELLGLEKPDRTPPQIEITDTAAQAISEGMQSQPGADLHLRIDDYWRCQFHLQPASGHEIRVEANGIVMYMDVVTAQRARGAVIDYTDSLQGTGLTVNLPEAPPPVQPLSVSRLKESLYDGTAPLVFDVRPPADHEKASVEFARPLDAEAMAEIRQMDKDTPIAFLCHHGNSSASTAEHFRKQGFTQVFNIEGGIDAWAREVDDTIPVY